MLSPFCRNFKNTHPSYFISNPVNYYVFSTAVNNLKNTSAAVAVSVADFPRNKLTLIWNWIYVKYWLTMPTLP